MAGFFSSNIDSETQNTNTNKYLYRTLEQDHQTQPSSSSSYYYNRNNNELWSQQMLYQHQSGAAVGGDETSRSDEEYTRLMMLRRLSGGTAGGDSGGGGGGTVNCQDCGNQAKKDCIHMRCRTCCKSRGFDCPTHVKSTWVPASVRRHRSSTTTQQVGLDNEAQGHFGHFKRRRDNINNSSINNSDNINNNNNIIVATSSSSSLVCSQLPITSTNFPGMELGNFPAEVSTQAVFRCVRVSSIDETEDEVAYQTAVNIGGHVFKGILYDQGPDQQHHHQSGGVISRGRGRGRGRGHGRGESTSGGGGPQLNLTARPTTSTGSLGLGYLDPSLYPAPLSPYMHPGTQFFPNLRP
ncbi:hypothetical protein RND81_13G181600 [Saponaria officinalis]|uniref:Uncharacterized protein n=1 Tax=Saponaria officinalis TaxID=3572 RepID=A0AAW1GZ59_SAPOF